MEGLKDSYALLCKALHTLHDSFYVLEKVKKSGDKDVILAAQDSIIQRFEYSYDSFWKHLKRYLEKYLTIPEMNSPRTVFRTCVQHNLCTPEEGELLLKMITARNITTHNYDIQQVRGILPDIPAYYDCMKKIVNAIKL